MRQLDRPIRRNAERRAGHRRVLVSHPETTRLTVLAAVIQGLADLACARGDWQAAAEFQEQALEAAHRLGETEDGLIDLLDGASGTGVTAGMTAGASGRLGGEAPRRADSAGG
jgi:hypothetical protein